MPSQFRNILLATILGVAALIATPKEAAAQSDILLQLRSGSPAGDRVRVDSAGGFVALGEIGIGIIPASGAGYRMMWYPFKAAFRAGGTDDGGAGNYWDDANIGFYSWAGGSQTIARGYASFSYGEQNVVETNSNYGIAMGSDNRCNGTFCLAIGRNVNADGVHAIAIGRNTTADARYSIALGYRASTNGQLGAFVMADSSASDSTLASAQNQFTTRYAGGYRLYSNAAKTLGAQLAPNATTFTALSDRNAKTDFKYLHNEDILRKIRAVPVSMWSYKDDPDRALHIGPMAQDFQKAFKLNDDDKGINTGDLSGVTLAGVRALDARTLKMQAEIKAKDKTIKDLEARIERLEAMLLKK